MIEHLPWIATAALIVLAAALGFFAGRKRPTALPQPPVQPPGGARMPDRQRQPDRAPAPGTRHSGAAAPQSQPARGGAALAIPSLASVTSWGYQLQNLDLRKAAASPFDLLVIDYAKDGTDDTALSLAEIDRLKRKPDGSRRHVTAYLSIGEAESYRYYWQKSWKRERPSWLLGENPEWEGNYSVCFWDPGWQRLICGEAESYLDRIIAQGFDGIYLDKCDVTEDLRAHFKSAAAARKNLDADMIAFVQRLSAYAKSRRPDFKVIMQNAEPLLAEAALRQAIDAVAKEELLFGLDRPEKPNSREEVAESRRLLDLVRRDGKPVLMVEYLDAPARITEAADAARRLGYILYVAPKDRELDSLRYPSPEV